MTGFSSLLCYPLLMPLIDIGGDSDDDVERVMNMVSLSEPVLDEGGQMLPVSDELIIIAQPRSTCMLFKQCRVILHRLGALPQLFEHRECVAGLVDHLESSTECSDECWVVGKWWCKSFHPLDDTGCLVGSVSLQKRAGCDYL